MHHPTQLTHTGLRVFFTCTHCKMSVYISRMLHHTNQAFMRLPQDHFIFLTVLIISMTFVLSLTQTLVFLSLYVMLSILLSILVCAAASLFCACLVSVHASAPYVIAGSTQFAPSSSVRCPKEHEENACA